MESPIPDEAVKTVTSILLEDTFLWIFSLADKMK